VPYTVMTEKPARDNAIDDSMRKAVEQVVYKTFPKML